MTLMATCAFCGSEIPPRVGKGRPRKYCSAECKATFDLSVKNAQYVPRERMRRAPTLYDIECVWCGNTFRTGRQTRKCCSLRCAGAKANATQWEGHEYVSDSHGHRARAMRYSAAYEVIRAADVFERDGWLCALCAEPVDAELCWPDPFSASLDHTIPLSRGGDHLMSNVRCTHLRCNISKGAKIDARSAPEANRAEARAR
jgi:5-methylcytosine-specific restriction endonuclease McrA